MTIVIIILVRNIIVIILIIIVIIIGILTDHLILVRWPTQVIVNKKTEPTE